MKDPNFFILGAPKCGTTSLATWISAHPNVYMPSVKEPFFFDTDEQVIGRPTPKEYLDMFSGVQDHHIAIGEASTTYLHSRLAVFNVLSYLDRCPKFIACVRNPIEMAISLHNHLLFHGIEHIDDFGKAWRSHGRCTGGSRAGAFRSHLNQLYYGPQCRLGEQIERLYRTVPEALVLVLVFDDIVREPGAEYSKVLRFLDLPDDGRHTFPVCNQGKEAKSHRVAKLTNLIAGAKQALRVRRGLGILRYIQGINTRQREKRPIPLELLTELCDYFRSDVEKLSKLLRRDLTDWTDPHRQEAHGSPRNASAWGK